MTSTIFVHVTLLVLQFFCVVGAWEVSETQGRCNEDSTVLKCDGGKLQLTCTQGVIHVRSGFYGVDQQGFCNNYRFVLT